MTRTLLRCSMNYGCISCVLQEQTVKGNIVSRSEQITALIVIVVELCYVIYAVHEIILQGNRT